MEVMPFSTIMIRRPSRKELATRPNPPASVCPVFKPSAVPACTIGMPILLLDIVIFK